MDDGPIHRTAHEDLRYIRRTLDAAGRFSSLSGKGMVTVGVLALAAVVANLRFTGAPWDAGVRREFALGPWVVLLVASVVVGVWATARKARRTGQVLWSPVLQKALWCSCAAMLLGGLLTAGVIRAGRLELLPAIWLGCYGTALTAAGMMSVSPVRWMGVSFLALAGIAVFAPPGFGLALLALGFGWLHVAFGAYIAWRHDG